MGPSLTLTDLTWAFTPGEAPFLHIDHLHLDPGQSLAVTGPSGAGKSTLLFLLAGLETPTSGSLLWGGHDFGRDQPARRDRWRRKNLGLVFQDFQLIPELSALDNVLLPVTFERFIPSGDDKSRARTLLETLGLARLDARASTLSRGEMQRTALARALLGRPPVVLADEPTASLDAANEQTVASVLLAYAREEGATVIVSTHQPLLRDRADRQLSLDHGRRAGEGA